MNKKPINIASVRDMKKDTGEISLSEACLDYMGIEYSNSTSEFKETSKKHVQQQLRTGEALVVKLTHVDFDQDDENKVLIDGEIDYRNFPYENPGDVLSALRLKEPSGTTSGSFVRAIPLNRKLEPKEDVRDHQLYKYPSLTIESLNIGDRNTSTTSKKPMTGTVKLSGLNTPSQRTKFVPGKKMLKLERGDEAHKLSEGDVYLLTKSVGDYTFQSALYALKNSEYSDTASLVTDLMEGTSDNTSTAFSQTRVDEFINWMQNSNSKVLPLNDKQANFTKDVNTEVSLLQGPPGTGKTSGATAPAIVSRLLAHKSNKCRTLVTGASNKAINEVFEKTVELVDAYNLDSSTSDALSDVLFLRVAEPPENFSESGVNPADYDSEIAFTALYGNEAEKKYIGEIRSRLRDQLSGRNNRHIVIFATPRRTWRVGKKVIPEFRLTEDETIDGRVPNSKRQFDDTDAYGLFDVLVADEASMMNLPQFLLTGTFYQRGGNLLLSGDHRQLPPVQRHDWSSDYKPSITSLAPHLSVLDFFRLLGGEQLNSIDEEKQELLRVTNSTANVDIPLHQLERTYRCHEKVAGFLNDWVYEKLDSLEYTSNETKTLANVASFTDGVDAAMASEKPIVVVTYDDTTHQQSNPLESKLATSLLRVASSETTSGIVTPHNAQRGLLETDMQLQSNMLNSNPDIDTVERFQGGERDLIIVSATVSDPDYIAAESEFLLNLNRLNVAMSRMKKKLVVIASESVFDHIPVDVDEYNDALLWKGLAKESGVSSLENTSVWSGKITEFTRLDASNFIGETSETTVKVHYV